MLAKITKGREFYRCLSYVLNKSGAEILESNMVGKTASELAIEFQLSQQQHQRQPSPRKTQKIVCHVSLSVEIGKNLDSETWIALAKDYLDAMSFDQNQYALARHTDTEHDHVHLVISRLRIDGSTVPDWLDYRRTETILRTLEEKYQLQAVQSSWETTIKPPTVAEIRQFRRTQQPSVRTILQVALDDAAEGNPSFEVFSDRLRNMDVSFRLRLTPDGVRGISYKFHTIAFPGYKLGKRYTWQGLQTYFGVQYESTHAPTSQEDFTRSDFTTRAGDYEFDHTFAVTNKPTRTIRTSGISNQSVTEQTQTSSSASQSRRKANTRSTTPVANRGVSGAIASSTRESKSGVDQSTSTFRGGDYSDEQLLEDFGGYSDLGRRADQGLTDNQRQPATTHRAGECSDRTAAEAVGCDRENSQPTASTRPNQTQCDADLRTASTLQPLDRLQRNPDDPIRTASDQFTRDRTPSSTESKEPQVASHENDDADILWQLYSKNVQTKNPVEKDLGVAWKALQDGCNRSKVASILWKSPYVRWLWETQGSASSQSYVNLTIRAVSASEKRSRAERPTRQKQNQEVL
ncbi:relaxase/mobilization nuclease domain-containing protein [Cyanobacteria bacterium FACHB-63]|nr:relaxase/mobilization nuclease domain-containing protein [Cyanobacteria bacterium FACHB-63]